MDTCYRTMALSAAERLYERLHSERPYHDGSFQEWAKKPSQQYPFHFKDGRKIWVSSADLTPEADWLGSVAEQSPREQDQPADDPDDEGRRTG